MTFNFAESLTTAVNPPPVNEMALAARLVDMAQPSPGERAVVVFDPTYYTGITTQLRESLHARGVRTYTFVEDTPAMLAASIADGSVPGAREADIVEALTPIFQRANLFYRMPTRCDDADHRWDQLIAGSRVRAVHVPWLRPFPGGRTAGDIAAESRSLEERSLQVGHAAHARRQVRLADALRGRTLRVTTRSGTDLTLAVRPDEWFHFGTGDASRAATARARWIRDRVIRLPIGLFQFVSDPDGASGVIAAQTIDPDCPVRDIHLRLERGRVIHASAAEGAEWICTQMRRNGPDGDRIALVSLDTNPLSLPAGVTIDIGSNWKNGGSNDAARAWRLSIRLGDATVTADGRAVMRSGQLLTEDF